MIRKLIDRLFGRRAARAPQAPADAPVAAATAQAPRPREPARYVGTEQGVHVADVPHSAMRTCETLQKAGFKAFIVGGGVRDLLLDLKPKDFDVATDATPEQVAKLFRRSRLIGRRFQIVHVMFGRDTIEVSTFRALQTDAETDEHGRVLRDNVWGSQSEDATRRDFTINALYYDPVADVILDYHDGVRDLKHRTLRMIGDAATRYREDPVRMLRAARLAAKTGFTIDERTRAPIQELAPLIHNVPAARLFDEMLKLLTSGHAVESVHQLRNEGLHHGLLPLLDVILEQPDGERFVRVALTSTDARVQSGKPVSPGFLFATLLWQQVRVRWQERVAAGEQSIPALHEAIDSVVDEQSAKLAIQKRIIADMREVWALQPRFERRNGSAPYRLLEHLRFRAGFDFLLLRCEAGEASAELGAWWTRFVDADGHERAEILASVPSSGAPRKRRRRRSGARRDDADAPAADVAAEPPPSSAADGAPRRGDAGPA
ncbi:MAG: polynucleotide adenylyltransferase PcnB [Burkholderiaceae bacterium]